MKKHLLYIGIILMSFSLTSCFNTKICCGDISENTPVIKVNSQTNHHFIYGLVAGGKTKQKAKTYVEDAPNYVIKTNQSFINGFLSMLTCGIYTPTTTTYYIPLKDIQNKNK